MTTVIFKIEKNLKEAAQKKAKKEGVTLTEFYRSATKSFIDGTIGVGLIYPRVTPNSKTARLLRYIDKEIKEGKGLSPVFDNTKDANHYLDTL